MLNKVSKLKRILTNVNWKVCSCVIELRNLYFQLLSLTGECLIEKILRVLVLVDNWKLSPPVVCTQQRWRRWKTFSFTSSSLADGPAWVYHSRRYLIDCIDYCSRGISVQSVRGRCSHFGGQFGPALLFVTGRIELGPSDHALDGWISSHRCSGHSTT